MTPQPEPMSSTSSPGSTLSPSIMHACMSAHAGQLVRHEYASWCVHTGAIKHPIMLACASTHSARALRPRVGMSGCPGGV